MIKLLIIAKLQALQPQIEHRVCMVLRVYKLHQHVA